MLDIKFGEIYLSKYTAFHKAMRKGANILTLVLSLTGVFKWKFFENHISLIFIIIAVIQVLLLLKSEVIRSDKDIEEIIALKVLYVQYYLELEKLWYNFNSDKINEEKASAKYFSLEKKYWLSINEIDAKINVKRNLFLIKSTEKESNIYINKYLNHE